MVPNPLNLSLVWICNVWGQISSIPTNTPIPECTGPETTWAGSSWHISDLGFHQSGSSGKFQLGGDCGWFFLRLGVWECGGVLFSPSTKLSFPTHRQTWKESPFSNTLLNPEKLPICKKKKMSLAFCLLFVLSKTAIKYHAEYANHFCHTCLLKHCLFHYLSLTSQDWILRFSALKTLKVTHVRWAHTIVPVSLWWFSTENSDDN